MVSKYFNYVLVLAMLIGVSAPLPQVKNQITSLLDSTTISSNSALAFGSVTSSPLQSQCSTPEQVINILARAGIIPTSKVNDAFRIVKSLPGSDGSPVPVPENKGTASSTASTTQSNVVVTTWTVARGTSTVSQNGVWIAAYPMVSITVTNNGNNPAYINKDMRVAFPTTIMGASANVSISNVTATGSTSGDTVGSYIINNSRTFKINYTVENRSGSSTPTILKVAKMNYGYGTSAGQDSNLSSVENIQSLLIQLP